MQISDGQPFRLNVLHAFAEHMKDPEIGLPALLQEGVPTGIFDEFPSSNPWQQRPHDLIDDSMDDIQLQHCTGNWTRAERDPALLKSPLQKEIDAGQVVALPGRRPAAEAKWPQRTANIVVAEGRDPRLVLDSIICNKYRVPHPGACHSAFSTRSYALLTTRRSLQCMARHSPEL